MELILIIGLVVLVGIVVFIIITHQYSDSEDAKERRAFVKFMKAMKIKSNGKYYKYALQLDKSVHSRIMKCFTIARELLMTLDNPYNCPHGRPTLICITKTELDRKFKRIV